MSSYRQIFYHIVFRTKRSRKTIPLDQNKKLFAYLMGVLKNKSCHLYRINGMQDHIHMLIDLHPSIALADLMRDLKTSSSVWLKHQKEFTQFDGWADGYAAITISYGDKNMVIEYIKNQQKHHEKESFTDEFRKLLLKEGIKVDELYFLK